MHEIEATYRIVTPMFLGGASPEQLAIRPPSVKGALRFWWRALNWGRVRIASGSDEDALKCLHREEAGLFGSAADEDKRRASGQARFLLQVSENTENGNPTNVRDGQKYMLGQGLISPRGEFGRRALLRRRAQIT